MLDRDIKDKGNKEMYLNVFDGKRNRATVQRGYSLIQLLVVIVVGFNIGDGGIYGLPGIGPLGQPACGSCSPAGKCALYGAVLHEEGQL